ncbi:MAG: tungsten ABC transporter substrate-binding protein, partial [Burkholderiaceae bacterium]|nr:tungsten ABC transporter substrate-binding protein [Burkholderiaceae bacterium]
FISRGDNSGTNNAELRFWVAAGQTTKGAGYKACGCGMGPALNMASASSAYVMSDRATWLNFKNKGDLTILVQGDERLFNQYGVMVVSPIKHPHLNTQAAQIFANWVVSAAGQASIASYTVAGEQLFFPNAEP